MKYGLTYWTVVEADSPADAVVKGQELLSQHGHEFEPDTIEPLDESDYRKARATAP